MMNHIINNSVDSYQEQVNPPVLLDQHRREGLPSVVVEFAGNGTLVKGRIRQLNEYFCTILADDKLWPLVADKS